MKKTLLIVLFISVGFSQRLSEAIESYDNGNVKSITYHKKTRTGIEKVKYEEYRKNGQKRLEETYKNGKQDGLWTIWYDNVRKKSEATYKDGKEDGKFISWHENGQEYAEIHYIDGKEDGLATRWYDNGKKKSEATLKDGQLDGLATRWYENGQKMSEKTYKNGIWISKKLWNEDGSVRE